MSTFADNNDEIINSVFVNHPTRFKQAPRDVLRGVDVQTQNGQAYVDGKPLAQYIDGYAKYNPHCVATTLAEEHDQGKSRVKAKSDLVTVQDKIAYINAHSGLYESLPLNRPAPIDFATMDAAGFKALSVTQKVAIQHERGAEFLARLQRDCNERTRKQSQANLPTQAEWEQAKLRGIPYERFLKERNKGK